MIRLYIGTETGTAEYVADEIVELFEQYDKPCQIEENFDQDSLTPGDILLFCTSTHGAGDVPNNLRYTYDILLKQPDLSRCKHLVIGLGDSSYDTFCKAATDINEALNRTQSTAIRAPILVDAMSDSLPEDLVLPQLKQIIADL